MLHPRINRRCQSDPKPSEIDGNLSIDCSGSGSNPKRPSLFIPFKKKEFTLHMFQSLTFIVSKPLAKECFSLQKGLLLKPVGAIHTEAEDIISMLNQ